MEALRVKRHWIFDLDGTLVLRRLDFDAIRVELDLPPGIPVLESIAALAPARAVVARARLAAIEARAAALATPSPGAAALLDRLRERGIRRGILTRNSVAQAWVTLNRSGLAPFFHRLEVLGRESVAPKPAPAGILDLLRIWGAEPEDALVVGDFRFDLLAGRAAGVETVYLDPSGTFPWAEFADRCVRSLSELIPA